MLSKPKNRSLDVPYHLLTQYQDTRARRTMHLAVFRAKLWSQQPRSSSVVFSRDERLDLCDLGGDHGRKARTTRRFLFLSHIDSSSLTRSSTAEPVDLLSGVVFAKEIDAILSSARGYARSHGKSNNSRWHEAPNPDNGIGGS